MSNLIINLAIDEEHSPEGQQWDKWFTNDSGVVVMEMTGKDICEDCGEERRVFRIAGNMANPGICFQCLDDLEWITGKQTFDHNCPHGVTELDQDWIDDGVVVFDWACEYCGKEYKEQLSRDCWEEKPVEFVSPAEFD